MPPRKKTNQEMKLTDVELELMNILWRLGGATVHEVLQQLPKERPLAYTSVSTMLRILEQKKIVRSEAAGRGHRYVPLLRKESYEKLSVAQLVQNVFAGETTSLVRRLIDDKHLSAEDFTRLRNYLDERSKQ